MKDIPPIREVPTLHRSPADHLWTRRIILAGLGDGWRQRGHPDDWSVSYVGRWVHPSKFGGSVPFLEGAELEKAVRKLKLWGYEYDLQKIEKRLGIKVVP